jgi:hypothetical protein
LAADISRLELMISLIKLVNPLNLGNTATQTQREACERQVRTVTAMIHGWRNTAKAKLASEYLAP